MCPTTILVLFAMIGAGPEAARHEPAAADFRIDNAVYVGDDKEPICRSSTIFHQGMVYDCMKSPAETIVFDMAAGRFVMLDTKHRTRSELTTGIVEDFTDSMQEVAVRSSDPLVQFLAAPKFQEQFDAASGSLTLSSPLVVYRMTLRPEQDSSVVAQYHEFSDWYARLNTLLSPGSRPPFGRLLVNAALARRGATVSEVSLTLTSGGPKQQPITIRSEHRLVRQLTETDLDRIAEARKQIVGFKPIRFTEYRKTDLR